MVHTESCVCFLGAFVLCLSYLVFFSSLCSGLLSRCCLLSSLVSCCVYYR